MPERLLKAAGYAMLPELSAESVTLLKIQPLVMQPGDNA